MRKIVCSSLLVALLAATVSCNNIKGGKTEYNEKSSQSASNIIEYTNTLVDMSNSHNRYLERLGDNVDRVEKALTDLDKPNNWVGFSGIIKPFTTPTPYSKVKPEEPVSELSKEDRTFFKEKVTAYLAQYNSLKKSYDVLDDYLTAQDYKDDKGVKGQQLVDTLRVKLEKTYALKSELMKKVEVVADASEEVVLKDSPLKDYIIAMKGDIKSVRAFIDTLADNGDQYAAIADKAKAQYDALEKAQTEHAAINPANAKKEHKDSQFSRFYEELHDFLLDARKIMREAGEKGEITESHMSTLDSDYDSMISSYNSFNS